MKWYETDKNFYENEQKSLFTKYPKLEWRVDKNGDLKLEGLLTFTAFYENEPITDTYRVRFHFPG